MRNIKVIAEQHPDGMAIYAKHAGGTDFVMTHRKNNNLFFYLQKGDKSLLDIKTYRPGRNKAEQLLGKSLSFVAKMTEYVMEETAA